MSHLSNDNIAAHFTGIQHALGAAQQNQTAFQSSNAARMPAPAADPDPPAVPNQPALRIIQMVEELGREVRNLPHNVEFVDSVVKVLVGSDTLRQVIRTLLEEFSVQPSAVPAPLASPKIPTYNVVLSNHEPVGADLFIKVSRNPVSHPAAPSAIQFLVRQGTDSPWTQIQPNELLASAAQAAMNAAGLDENTSGNWYWASVTCSHNEQEVRAYFESIQPSAEQGPHHEHH